jgi:amino acid permease
MKNPNTLHWKEENNGRDTVPKTPEFKRLTSNARSLSFKALMKRNSTFWPSTEEILSKRPSLEFLNPEFYSKTRKSSPLSAIFNLVATVCGGGVLTLPIAFSRAGIIPSTILMIFSAYITDFAMYILCAAARRTGGRSYGDVARLAFGAKAEIFITLLLFTFLYFVIVAYLVLVKDIWTPMIMHMFPTLHQWCIERWNIDPDTSKIPGDVFLIGFIVVSLPLLLNKDIYALRHTCYVGFASLLILVVAIVKKAYEVNFVTHVGIFHNEVKWWHDDINDVIYAFPIIALSFFSIYNVLSVHSALTNPTRERMKFVLDWTIILCLV